MIRTSALRRALVAGTLALGILGTPQAALASGSAVVKDCADDGSLSKKYTSKDYSDALKNIPTDVDEYTDCRDVIRRAQLSAGGKKSSGSGGDSSGGGSSSTGGGTSSGGGGTSGGSTAGTTGGSGSGDTSTATSGGSKGNGLNAYDNAVNSASDDEKGAIDQAKSDGGVTGASVDNSAFKSDDGDGGIPTPLIIVLALLVVGGLAAAFPKLRDLVGSRP